MGHANDCATAKGNTTIAFVRVNLLVIAELKKWMPPICPPAVSMVATMPSSLARLGH